MIKDLQDKHDAVVTQLLVGRPVYATVTDDSAGDTPFRKGEKFRVGKVKLVQSLRPPELQYFSLDGWGLTEEEVRVEL